MSWELGSGLYEIPSEFAGRYIQRSGKSMGSRGGQKMGGECADHTPLRDTVGGVG
jgi:hypothetical protein